MCMFHHPSTLLASFNENHNKNTDLLLSARKEAVISENGFMANSKYLSHDTANFELA